MPTQKSIQGYLIIEKLGEGLFSEVFKVHPNDEPENFLVFKIIKRNTGYEGQADFIRKQVDRLKHIDIPGVIPYSDFLSDEGRPLLIRKWFEGRTLTEWIKTSHGSGIGDFLRIARFLACTLRDLHNDGLFHGGIKPNNILINPETLELALIDLARVFEMNRMGRFIYDKEFRTSTLAYISPEQTGRIRREVSFGTDFYSVGTVFYELLHGNPPFKTDDPLEVIHSHLAQEPSFPNMSGESIEGIQDIVSRLMAKEPAKRYQSWEGLLHDLEHCENEYEQTKKIAPFTLGMMDHSHRIYNSYAMVGREREKERLLYRHAQSLAGSFYVAVVSGSPGIGKTRLIEDLQIPIISRGGYFAAGKADPYQQKIPYSSMTQVFESLIRIILTENETQLADWQNTINRAIEPNGILITEMVPMLEILIGKQPEIPPMPLVESRNRFNNTLEKFISCLAGPDHPVTLFLDDLQWCDNATLEVVEKLFSNSDKYPYLFLVGAFRSDEGDEAHPLESFLARIRKAGHLPLELQIEKLNQKECDQMTAHILNSSLEKTGELSGIISRIADGNPLYLKECLKWMHQADLISMDRKKGWVWDIEKIKATKIPDTIVSMLSGKLVKLPKKTQELLWMAACFGANFTVEDIRMIRGINSETLREDLEPAFHSQLLVRTEDHIRFFHDRVKESILAGLDQEDRRKIHSGIAEALLQTVPSVLDLKDADNIIELTRHLNMGRGTKIDIQRRYRDATVNLYAAQKSVALLAIDAANEFYNEGNNLLGEDCWENEYDLTFSIKKNLVLNDFAQGKREKAEELLNEVLSNVANDIDKADILVEQSILYGSLGQFEESLKAGLQVFDIFDIKVSQDAGEHGLEEPALMEKMKRVVLHETSRSEIVENEAIIIIRCCIQMIVSFYALGRIDDCFRTGLVAVSMFYNSESRSVRALLNYPLMVAAGVSRMRDEHTLAEKLEQESLDLSAANPNTFSTGRSYVGGAWMNLNWSKSVEDIEKIIVDGTRSAMNCGDLFYHGLASVVLTWAYFIQGNDFQLMEEQTEYGLGFSEKYGLPAVNSILKGFLFGGIVPLKFGREERGISRQIKAWEESNDSLALTNYYTHKACSMYFLNDEHAFYEAITKGWGYIKNLPGTFPEWLWHTVFVLNSLKRYGIEEDPLKRDEISASIEPALEKVKYCAAFGPALKPYVSFVEAEKTRVFGGFEAAKSLYLEAIDKAAEQKYTLLEGHIHECLGELLWEQGIDQAGFHLKEALNLFEQCHATAKEKKILEKYAECVASPDKREPAGAEPVKKLDTLYMMKAAGAISGELELDELLKTIVKSVMEGLGAQQGYIIMEDDLTLVVRARGAKDGTLEVFVENEPLESAKGIGRAIIHYVQRTQESVILDNAMKQGPFVGDWEVQRLKLRSVLCLPILRGQRLIGIIYLQNNLIGSMFSEENVELVKLLASQAAISLENAGLVEEMKSAEKHLRESEERYRRIINTAMDGIAILDGKGILLEVNPAYCEMLGYSYYESIDMPVENVIHPDHRHHILDEFAAQITEKGNVLLETVGMRKDGSLVSAEIHGVGMSYGDEDVFLAIVRDITERKRIEEELVRHQGQLEYLIREKTAQLEAAQKELLKKERLAILGKLTATVSHEIRNPLGTIRTSLFSVTQRIRGKKLGLEKALARAERSIVRCDRIIEELLDFTRTRDLSPEPIMIDEWLTEALKDIQIPKGITFAWKPGAGMKIALDKEHFRRCLVNVLDNAIKAIEEKREDIEAQGHELGEDQLIVQSRVSNERLEILVTDTGKGISLENTKKIFEPLFTTRGFGIGLGLSIVKQIMVQHGGGVEIESNPGNGTQVTLWLPLEV
ncbi:MAG: AAA family ATPase [Thermodesulfobacteriota bacterium]|nr:AAA family ATPase [Thermodesulfobacteriota bacterium]